MEVSDKCDEEDGYHYYDPIPPKTRSATAETLEKRVLEFNREVRSIGRRCGPLEWLSEVIKITQEMSSSFDSIEIEQDISHYKVEFTLNGRSARSYLIGPAHYANIFHEGRSESERKAGWRPVPIRPEVLPWEET